MAPPRVRWAAVGAASARVAAEGCGCRAAAAGGACCAAGLLQPPASLAWLHCAQLLPRSPRAPPSFTPRPAPRAEPRNDWEEGSTALGHHLIDFWTNVCLCQSLIIEKNPEGPDLPTVYQVRSAGPGGALAGRGWPVATAGEARCLGAAAGRRRCVLHPPPPACCPPTSQPANLSPTDPPCLPSPAAPHHIRRAHPPTRWRWWTRRARWALSSGSARRRA